MKIFGRTPGEYLRFAAIPLAVLAVFATVRVDQGNMSAAQMRLQRAEQSVVVQPMSLFRTESLKVRL